MKSRRAAVPLLLLASFALAACNGPAAAQPSAGPKQQDVLQVAANFYPVQFLAQRIGGQYAAVTGMTPPGTEPHDLTLSGKALQQLQSSDVVLYLGSSFQPDVEKAVTALPEHTAAVDLLTSPGLELLDPPDSGAGDGEAAEKDPHVWLDPNRLKVMAKAAAEAMKAADSGHASAYEANLEKLLADLDALDKDLAQQLDGCRRKALLTSHAAFGYFADRYGMTQIAIAGISPDDEPDAKTLADISKAASTAGVKSVFLEEELNPALAETVAGSIGATIRTLSALEFDPGNSKDVLTVLRDNGEQISEGVGCR